MSTGMTALWCELDLGIKLVIADVFIHACFSLSLLLRFNRVMLLVCLWCMVHRTIVLFTHSIQTSAALTRFRFCRHLSFLLLSRSLSLLFPFDCVVLPVRL